MTARNNAAPTENPNKALIGINAKGISKNTPRLILDDADSYCFSPQ